MFKDSKDLANCVNATLLGKIFLGSALDPARGGGGAQTPSSIGLAPFMRWAHKGCSQVRLRRTQVTPFKKSWIGPWIG